MKLELTDIELSLIDKAIQELPFKYAAPLINKINEQLSRQNQECNDDPVE